MKPVLVILTLLFLTSCGVQFYRKKPHYYDNMNPNEAYDNCMAWNWGIVTPHRKCHILRQLLILNQRQSATSGSK